MNTVANVMGIVLASLAVAVGVGGTLMMLTFLMACGANATPEAIRNIKLFMLASGFVGLASFAGGIGLIIAGRNGWAALAGAFPMIFMIGSMIWVSVRSAH